MKIYWVVVTLTCLGFAAGHFAWSQATPAPGPVNVQALMQRKLSSSQALVKGLALEDFKLLQREAQQLQLLNLDAGWNVVQTEDYARISRDFREAAKKIRKAGQDKNLDAAGLAYFQLTMTCIDCHRHVRKVQTKPKSLAN